MDSVLMVGMIFTFFMVSNGSCFAQNEYPHGNAAYNNEAFNNFSDVTIGGGNFVYTYNHDVAQYQYANYILIPDLIEQANGNYVSKHTFFGFGTMGNPTDTMFQWDALQVIENSAFDRPNLFVSPLSEVPMNYASLLDINQTDCTSENCYVTIIPPNISLAWPNYAPGFGSYEMCAGEELVNAGDLKAVNRDSKHSQQQLGVVENPSYCVSQYGEGWRLPTDIEVGHFNDEEGSGNGYQAGYQGVATSKYMWTCSLFKTFSVKRWPVRVSDGHWENCAGFLYMSNYARCVFDPFSHSATNIVVENADESVNLYPNPTSNKLTIQFDDVYTVSIRVLSTSNLLIKTICKNQIQKLTIDLSDMSPGIYYIEIYMGNKPVICKKIIIQS